MVSAVLRVPARDEIYCFSVCFSQNNAFQIETVFLQKGFAEEILCDNYLFNFKRRSIFEVFRRRAFAAFDCRLRLLRCLCFFNPV